MYKVSIDTLKSGKSISKPYFLTIKVSIDTFKKWQLTFVRCQLTIKVSIDTLSQVVSRGHPGWLAIPD